MGVFFYYFFYSFLPIKSANWASLQEYPHSLSHPCGLTIARNDLISLLSIFKFVCLFLYCFIISAVPLFSQAQLSTPLCTLFPHDPYKHILQFFAMKYRVNPTAIQRLMSQYAGNYAVVCSPFCQLPS